MTVKEPPCVAAWDPCLSLPSPSHHSPRLVHHIPDVFKNKFGICAKAISNFSLYKFFSIIFCHHNPTIPIIVSQFVFMHVFISMFNFCFLFHQMGSSMRQNPGLFYSPSIPSSCNIVNGQKYLFNVWTWI